MRKTNELAMDQLDQVTGGTVAECIALGYLLIKVGDKTGAWKWWQKRLGV